MTLKLASLVLTAPVAVAGFPPLIEAQGAPATTPTCAPL